MFPLAALGAGLGQFVQDYQRQQEVAKQTMMLQMQIADFQRKMRLDQQETEAAGAVANFDPSALFGGGRPTPIQGLPQVAPAQGGQQTQPGSSFEGQYTGYPFPMTRTNGQFPALPPNTTNNAGVLGPGFPTQASTMGSDRLAQLPPPRGGQPADPLRGLPTDTATTTEQAAALARGLAGTLAGGGAQPGGTQMAQAAPAMEPAPEDVTKITTHDIQLLLRKNNPTMSGGALANAAQKIHADLLKDYELKLKRWQAVTGAAGDAQSRAIQSRKVDVDERQGNQRIGLEGQRLGLDTGTQGDLKQDRAKGRELEAGRLAEQRRSVDTAQSRASAKADVEKKKVEAGAQELRNLINRAEALAAQAMVDPSLVGTRAWLGRNVGGAIEQATGARPGGLGVGADKFKSEIQLLQEALQKPLQSARYSSKHSTDRMNELVPTVSAASSSSQVAAALRNISRELQVRLSAMEAATGAVAEDVGTMTREDALKALGFDTPAGQR
jgi:hypothetical protein